MATDRLPADLSRIEHMIAAAQTPTQVKHVIALADAAIAYANRFYSEHKEVVQRAKAVKLQAERRLGELLKAAPKATGGEHGGRHSKDGSRVEPSNPTPTLSDLGIDKKLSARAQRLAELPAETFAAVAAGEIPVSQALKAKKPPRRKVRTEAAAARKEAIEVAQSNHISMFAAYARQTLRELRLQTTWSDEELRLADELADECRRVVGKAQISQMI